MGILYKADSWDIENVSPKNGKFFTYEELQNFVKDGENGMVEIVPMPSGRSMVVNEEGKLIGLKMNNRATDVWKAEYPIEKYPNNNDELIVGNALVVEDNELEQG
jgi:hypothetical protein